MSDEPEKGIPGALKTSSLLYEADIIYQALVDHVLGLRSKASPEILLDWVQAAAEFAQQLHTGRFADGSIENLALDIGRRLESPPHPPSDDLVPEPPEPRESTKRHLLHVATRVFSVGGHTRLIANWIKNDVHSHHSLVLTRQRVPVPDWLSDAVCGSGGHVIALPRKEPLLRKAGRLRRIAQANVDAIILHHDPSDAVPVVALATEQCPPVAVMNHADHLFWLGGSVADTIIDYRTSGTTLSEKRRFARHTAFLPLPLNVSSPAIPRSEARRQLGLSNVDVMLLSIGQAYKYSPTNTHDFFSTSVKLLQRNPQAHLYLIGVGEDGRTGALRNATQDRFHLLGVREDITAYQAAADIYLEGFPGGSSTAMLEPAAFGVCPVRQFAPLAEFSSFEDIAWRDVLAPAETEEEYLEQVGLLIRCPEKREETGRRIRERVTAYHMGTKWHRYLQQIYAYLESTPHTPGPIPASTRVETRDDLALSLFSELFGVNACLTKEVIGGKALSMGKHHLKHRQNGLAVCNFILAFRMRPSLIKTLLRESAGRCRAWFNQRSLGVTLR